MRVAVTSPFFHLLPYLKKELLAVYPNCKFKETFDQFDKNELIDFCADCDFCADLLSVFLLTDLDLSG